MKKKYQMTKFDTITKIQLNHQIFMFIYLQGTNLLLFLYNLLTDKLSKLIKIIKLMDPRPYHY